MWSKVKTWIGDYADRWTREQVEAEVRNYIRLGGGAVAGAGVAEGSWLAIVLGMLPFIAVQIWYHLSRLNDPQPPANT